jgi:hypothetical protein
MLNAELPGFTKEDIDIRIQGNQLILRGERKQETEAKEEQYHRIGRAYGRFERTFWLPTPVDSEKIQGSFKDGVLELRLPKNEAAKPKRIAITEAEGAPAGREQTHSGEISSPPSEGGRTQPRHAEGGLRVHAALSPADAHASLGRICCVALWGRLGRDQGCLEAAWQEVVEPADPEERP